MRSWGVTTTRESYRTVLGKCKRDDITEDDVRWYTMQTLYGGNPNLCWSCSGNMWNRPDRAAKLLYNSNRYIREATEAFELTPTKDCQIKDSMWRVMSDRDFVELEIFSRLPMSAGRKVREVCKAWG
ncbi:hypothetical protein RND81_01G063000 [Saponaria officinalis]|uniref:Uncharacterized protein n=1 Tax=Saponaria officinalis TaxID=3572 RepID=A0AAW1NC02_SAPOF